LDKIQNSRYIVIVTHINPDLDTFSSALAFSSYFHKHKIKHKVFNTSFDTKEYNNFDILPRFDKIVSKLPDKFDLIISVDCADVERFGFDYSQYEHIPLINIDHHISNNLFGDLNIVLPESESATRIVYNFFKENQIKIDKDIATCLYAGIYDDSKGFSTDRVNQETLKAINDILEAKIDISHILDNLYRRDSLAKYRLLPKILDSLELFNEGKIAIVYLDNIWLEETGATLNESSYALDLVLNISVVEIAVFLREIKARTIVSLRAKNKKYNLYNIATKFGGGGHPLSAGFSLDITPAKNAIDKVLEILQEEITNTT
jgi:phosphoesterase RecJ-like protein